MIPAKIRVGLVLLALVACQDEKPKMATVAQTFPTLPLPPQPTLVARSGSSDALQLTVRSPMKPQEVVAYYRGMLTKNQWKLVNDMRDKDGSTVLLADHGGRPLWVRISSTEDSSATLVELAGAVADTTKSAADTAKAAPKKAGKQPS